MKTDDTERRRPTVKEIERILESEGDRAVTIEPDGSISYHESDHPESVSPEVERLLRENALMLDALEKLASTDMTTDIPTMRQIARRAIPVTRKNDAGG